MSLAPKKSLFETMQISCHSTVVSFESREVTSDSKERRLPIPTAIVRFQHWSYSEQDVSKNLPDREFTVPPRALMGGIDSDRVRTQ